MATKQENERLNELSTQFAVMAEKVSTMKEGQDEMRSDIKGMAATIQGFTFVKEDDFLKRTHIVDGRLNKFDERIGTLERNTTVLVKIKNAVGEKGTQLLVLVILAIIVFGFYLILKHLGTTEVLNGAGGAK